MWKVHEFTIVFTEPDYIDEVKYILGRIHDFLEEQEFVQSLSVGSSDDGGTIMVHIGADQNVPVQDVRLKVIESFPKTSRPAGILRLV